MVTGKDITKGKIADEKSLKKVMMVRRNLLNFSENSIAISVMKMMSVKKAKERESGQQLLKK